MTRNERTESDHHAAGVADARRQMAGVMSIADIMQAVAVCCRIVSSTRADRSVREIACGALDAYEDELRLLQMLVLRPPI